MKKIIAVITVIVAGFIVTGCDAVRIKDKEQPKVHHIPQQKQENYVKMYEKCLQLKRENPEAKRIICSMDSIIVEKD